MPKDLTKMSLKELETVSGTRFDERMRWNSGALELTVFAAEADDFDEDDSEVA
jgi:hypothetical protein